MASQPTNPTIPPLALLFLSLPIAFPPLLCLANVIYPNTTLTPSSSSLWASPNGVFSMGFSSFLPNSYYVGVRYSSLPPNQSIVWTANRNHSVPFESGLHFTSDGRLVLTATSSPTSQPVWAASNLFFQDVVSQASQAELLDSGNFVLRDNTSRVIWQSFDHPTDTLLPDQNFTYSNNNSLVPWISTKDPSPSPKYGLVFGRTAGPMARIRLLSRNTDEYWSWPPPNVHDVLLNTTFTMDASGTLSLINGDGSLLWVEKSCDGTVPTNSIKKLQLSVDGNLRVLTWSTTTATWNTLWRALYLQCDVFHTCGENSICDEIVAKQITGGGGCPELEPQLEQICSCPESFTPNGSACAPPSSLNCSTTYMAQMEQTSFGIPGQVPSLSPVTLEVCRGRCLNDCNCTAVSYNTSSSCWLYTTLYNGVRSSNYASTTSFIRTISSNSTTATGSSGIALPSYAIALIVIATSLLVFLLLAALFIRHQIRSRHPRFKDVFLDLDPLISGPTRFTLEDLYTVTSGFHEKNKLGVGGFGTVFKGTFTTGPGKLDVAIKRLNHFGQQSCAEDDSIENSDFTAEITTLGCIKHVNVVNLVGFCAQGPERLLVYEFVANGSLSRHILSNSTILSWDLRFQIAVDAAIGIEYLHAHCPKKIVHRDIKPDNILVDENFRAKVADFGVSQIMGPERTHLTNNMLRGTPTYMAPECWHVGALVTEKADAYSYGVVLLELVSGKMVTKSRYLNDGVDEEDEKGEEWGGERDHEMKRLKEREKSVWRNIKLPLEHARELMEQGRWENLVDERLQGVYDREDAKRLVRTVFWCLQGNPEHRPSMEDLVLMIKGHKDVPAAPIDGLFDVPLKPLFHSSPEVSASIMIPESLSQGR